MKADEIEKRRLDEKGVKKGCKEEPYNLVGMTRFERATSRPPDGERRVWVRVL